MTPTRQPYEDASEDYGTTDREPYDGADEPTAYPGHEPTIPYADEQDADASDG